MRISDWSSDVCSSDLLDPGPFEPGPFEIVRPADDEVAMFLYTSGSTGRPKGVPLTHHGHLWVIRTRGRGADASGHRFLVAAPLYHMNALAISKYALWSHATIVLLPQFRAAAYLLAVADHEPTWLPSVPTLLAVVPQEKEQLTSQDLPRVKIEAMGTEPGPKAPNDRSPPAFLGPSLPN